MANKKQEKIEVNEPIRVNADTHVDGDRRFEYFWASEFPNHPQSVNAMKRKGWEPVPDDAKIENNHAVQAEGGWKYGENLVLMRKPVEAVEEERRRKLERYRSRLNYAESEFEEKLEKTEGIETIKDGSPSISGRRTFYFSNNPLAKGD